MASTLTSVAEICAEAKRASRTLATLGSDVKNRALDDIADALIAHTSEILEANARDLEAGRESGLSDALMDRLRLDAQRIAAIAAGARTIARLPDPVGEVIDGFRLPNGLDVRKVRVPLGVVAVVYEARPNVTIDAAALCLKSGNAIVLRGSSTAMHSNAILAGVASAAATEAGLPAGSLSLVAGGGRDELAELATQTGVVDLIIPRGGEGLKAALKGVATVPVIYAASGNCHVYVDATADLAAAKAIALNAKLQRPGVCNAAETLLVHADVADAFLPGALSALHEAGVTLHGDERARAGAAAGGCRFIPRPTRTGIPSTSRSSSPSASSIRRPRPSSTSTSTAAGTPRRSSPDRRIRPAHFSSGSTRPASTSTPRHASPMVASSGWAPRSATQPRSSTRAVRSGSASCARSSTSSRATGTSDPETQCGWESSAGRSTRHILVTSSARRRRTFSSGLTA